MKTSILFTFSLLLFTCSAAVPLSWTVETSRVDPALFEAYQGETLTFEAALQSHGKPLAAPLNYSFYWQTNGMGSTYWEAPAQSGSVVSPLKGGSVVSPLERGSGVSPLVGDTNVLFATWLPAYDVGARVYNCFIGSPSNIYHAAFQLRLRPSPGAIPNALPLPTPVIDFAKVRVLNPPWGSGGGGCDTNAVDALANSAVVTNALTVATTNRVAALETATNNLSSSVSGLASSKADKATPVTAGNLAALTADGNLADSGIAKDIVLFSSTLLDNPITLAYGSGEGLHLGTSYNDGPWGHWLVYGVNAPWFIERNGQSPTDPREPATIGDISATNQTFSDAVLAVGLNIDTNSVAVLNEIADTFGGFPIEGTATTIGGLLAALAAAIAWLKKNKVQTLKLNDNSVETSADGGVAKLDDFFTESNSLLTGRVNNLIDAKVGDVNAVLSAALDGTEVA